MRWRCTRFVALQWRHTVIMVEQRGAAGQILVSQTDRQQQYWSGGYLPPRDQVQYVTLQPTRSKQHVTCQFPGGQFPGDQIDDGKQLASESISTKAATITNGLDHQCKWIMVCDDDGNLWMANDVDLAATGNLKPAASATLSSLLNPFVSSDTTEIPMLRNGRRGGYGGNYNESVEGGTLDRRLKDWAKQGLPKVERLLPWSRSMKRDWVSLERPSATAPML